jgi:hypothetical protein
MGLDQACRLILIFPIPVPPTTLPEVNYTIFRHYNFLGFYGSVAEISFLLEYDMAIGKRCTTFWDNVTVSPSRWDLFDVSNLEDEPTVFPLNTGDWLPNHAASDTRRAESSMESFKVVEYLLSCEAYKLNILLQIHGLLAPQCVTKFIEWFGANLLSLCSLSSYNCNYSWLKWKHTDGFSVRPIQHKVEI